MKLEKAINTLLDVINSYFETQGIMLKAMKDTALFGKESVLDSMGLVNVIVDIESHFLDEDLEISLISESAMSQRKSPFRTIETLAEFIIEQLGAIDE
jgi:acyl carrier protein